MIKTAPFVIQLQKMYDNADKYEEIGWNEEGTSIWFEHTTHFQEILLNHFKHDQIKSFTRQLHIYGFKRLTDARKTRKNIGNPISQFEHPSFQQDRPDLIPHIVRKAVKSEEGTQPRPKRNLSVDPIMRPSKRSRHQMRHSINLPYSTPMQSSCLSHVPRAASGSYIHQSSPAPQSHLYSMDSPLNNQYSTPESSDLVNYGTTYTMVQPTMPNTMVPSGPTPPMVPDEKYIYISQEALPPAYNHSYPPLPHPHSELDLDFPGEPYPLSGYPLAQSSPPRISGLGMYSEGCTYPEFNSVGTELPCFSTSPEFNFPPNTDQHDSLSFMTPVQTSPPSRQSSGSTPTFAKSDTPSPNHGAFPGADESSGLFPASDPGTSPITTPMNSLHPLAQAST
ncbi:hypothetical protein H4R33_001764 [Dimargaris cristalligena]|nr:hypothetical protein H4R33_001764 [Dimargaris cristalligena]